MKLAVAFILFAGFYLLFSTVKLDLPKPANTTKFPESLGWLPQDYKSQMEDALEEKIERSRVGDCECAVFRTETPEEQLPLLTRTTVTVFCNEEGQKKCEELCRVLARAADNNPDADARLCQILGNVEKLKPSIFARVCNDNYTFTGVTAPKTYCCRESKPQICEQAEVDIKDDKAK